MVIERDAPIDAEVHEGDAIDDVADDAASFRRTGGPTDDARTSSTATRASSVEATEPDWRAVLAYPGANLHLYGKREARRGRKMGHVTIVAATPEEARRIALEIADILGIERW